MRVKSYYGNTIREALDKARRELGPDASILASRHMDDGSAAYEVVCGLGEERTARPVAQEPALATRAPEPEKPAVVPKRSGPLTKIRSVLSRAAPGGGHVRAKLLSEGFTEDLAAEIAAGVSQRLRQAGRRQMRSLNADEALAAELTSRLRVSPQLGSDRSKRRIVALVGPPGSGKTTTLVKLAVRYGLSAPGPLRLVSADAYRVGGTDMLRAYAHGMAAQFDAAASAGALSQIVDGHAPKGLMLIDTPGLSTAEMASATGLVTLLSRHMDIDVHLVLPATLAPVAMTQTVERFRPFLPAKIIVTSADEVESCRCAIAQSLLLDTPISFIGKGQLVPEDLWEATAARLCGATSVKGAEAESAA